METPTSDFAQLSAELARLRREQPRAALELAERSYLRFPTGSLERAELLRCAGRAAEGLQTVHAAIEYYSLASDAFTEVGDARQRCACELGEARVRLLAGSYAQAGHMTRQVVQQAEEQGWTDIQMQGLVTLAQVASHEHRYEEALSLLAQCEEFFAANQQLDGHGAARRALAWALTGSGRIAEGRAVATQELQRLRENQALDSEISQLLNTLIFCSWLGGEFAEMRRIQQEQFELEQRHGRPVPLLILLYNMAIPLVQLGEFTEAKRSLQRAWDMGRREGDLRLLPPLQMLLSLIALHEGQPEMAVEYAELARTNMREFGTDENILLPWYLALAYLSAGKPMAASEQWSRRAALEPSIENWLELGWMRRALDFIGGTGYAGDEAAAVESQELAQRWLEEVAQMQSSFPPPPGLATAAAEPMVSGN